MYWGKGDEGPDGQRFVNQAVQMEKVRLHEKNLVTLSCLHFILGQLPLAKMKLRIVISLDVPCITSVRREAVKDAAIVQICPEQQDALFVGGVRQLVIKQLLVVRTAAAAAYRSAP